MMRVGCFARRKNCPAISALLAHELHPTSSTPLDIHSSRSTHSSRQPRHLASSLMQPALQGYLPYPFIQSELIIYDLTIQHGGGGGNMLVPAVLLVHY